MIITVPDSIHIIGLGLIGASIGAKLKKINPDIYISGGDLKEAEYCLQHGIIDSISTKDPDIIVVCTPVNAIAEIVVSLLKTYDSSIITDVGSVKSSILREVEKQFPNPSRFIPAHPIAGSHLTGAASANPELFAQKKVIITPTNNDDYFINKITSFWNLLESSVEIMDAEKHDMIYAEVSHLPQLISFAFAPHVNITSEFTRLSTSDINLWRPIFQANEKFIKISLDKFVKKLDKYDKSAILTPEIISKCLISEHEKYAGTGWKTLNTPAPHNSLSCTISQLIDNLKAAM